MILGDFNVHWNFQEDTDIQCLSEKFRSVNLFQHVPRRILKHGHILGLVIITREGDDLVRGVSVSSMLVNTEVSLECLFFPTHMIHTEIIN